MSPDAATPELILASASPRRRELLEERGLRLEVRPAGDACEDARAAGWQTLPVPEQARRLALLKALSITRELGAITVPVLAADTLVAHAGARLGKPRDRGEARTMLRGLLGSTHEVITGFAIVFPATGRVLTELVSTCVTLAPDDPSGLIDDYVEAGLADGKAGAYGIQDPLFAPLIASFEGSFENVVGLPVDEVMAALDRRREEER